MIAAATGAIQLVRMLRDDGPPVAAKITPTADFEPDVRWRAYQAQHPELQPGTGAVDAQYGVVFTVSVKLDGLEGEKVALRWRPLDPSGVELPTPPWVARALSLRPTRTAIGGSRAGSGHPSRRPSRLQAGVRPPGRGRRDKDEGVGAAGEDRKLLIISVRGSVVHERRPPRYHAFGPYASW